MRRIYIRVRTREQLNTVLSAKADQKGPVLQKGSGAVQPGAGDSLPGSGAVQPGAGDSLSGSGALLRDVHALLLDYELAGVLKDRELFGRITALFRERYLSLPDVLRQSRVSAVEQTLRSLPEGVGLIVKNPDELGLIQDLDYQGALIADAFLYAYNSEAIRYYLERFPQMRFLCSDELTDAEQRDMISSLERILPPEMEDAAPESAYTAPESADTVPGSAGAAGRFLYKAYGYQPLMITNQCLSRNYSDCAQKRIAFRDEKGGRFIAVAGCGQCSSTIYNGMCTYMLDKPEEQIGSDILLDFTIENREETERILHGEKPGEYTRGHHYRGID